MPTIPLFVSSTFGDFHAERDSIRDVVVPRLNAAIAHLGCRIELIDLRAGVQGSGDSESESDLRVLEVCAQEIERALPSFVVLVGARGGWTPRGELARTLLGGRGLAAVEDLSVTEIEVRLATRSARTPGSLTAVFRTDHPDYPDSWRERNESAQALKIRIAADESFTVAEYSAPPDAAGVLDLHDFEELVEERLRPGLIAQAQALAAPDDPILRATELFRGTRRPLGAAFAEIARSVLERLERGESVCLFGERGVGTSTAWCATLDFAEEQFDVRAVATGGTDIAAMATDVLRHVLQRPRPGDDLERQVDISSIVAVTASEVDRHEEEARLYLADDIALAGLDSDLPLLVAIDEVDGVLGASDRAVILDPKRRSDRVRWLVTTSIPAVREDLEAMGFEIVDIDPLEGEDLLLALQTFTRLLAPGRELPAPAIEHLASEPRAVAWLEAAMRLLLRPGREELESLPNGDGWLEAFDGRLIGMAKELSPDIGDLRSLTFRRAATFVGEERFLIFLAALEGSFLGLPRGVLSEVAALPIRDVARLTAMLDPVVRTTADGRLRVADLATLQSLVADLHPMVVPPMHERHERIAEMLHSSGIPDTASQIEYLWHIASVGRDISPVLRSLALEILPSDRPADTAALDDIFHILRRSGDSEVVIGAVDDTTVLLLGHLASRALLHPRAVEVLRRLRAGVARSDPGSKSRHLGEVLDARIAMAEFFRDRDDPKRNRHLEHVDRYLKGLIQRLLGPTGVTEWELYELLWSTATLMPNALPSRADAKRLGDRSLARFRILLSNWEWAKGKMLEVGGEPARQRVIFSCAEVMSGFPMEVKLRDPSFGLQLRDRVTEDLRLLADERPLDLSVRRRLIDSLLDRMGPPSEKELDRVREAVDLLRQTSHEGHPGSFWMVMRTDALHRQSKDERRLSTRATDVSLKFAAEAESISRRINSAMPFAPRPMLNLAGSIAERVVADPSTNGDEVTQSAVTALSEAAGLVATARLTVEVERDGDLLRLCGDVTFAIATGMIKHDHRRAIGLLEQAREHYSAAAEFLDTPMMQLYVAWTFLKQAECEIQMAKDAATVSDGSAGLTRWAGRARGSTKNGLRVLDRMPPWDGHDGPWLRSQLRSCQAEALIIPTELVRDGTRRELMEAAKILEKAGADLLGESESEYREEIREVVARLIERLLALDLDSGPFGSRRQRDLWSRLKQDLEAEGRRYVPLWRLSSERTAETPEK